jgi:hypothetical protein
MLFLRLPPALMEVNGDHGRLGVSGSCVRACDRL